MNAKLVAIVCVVFSCAGMAQDVGKTLYQGQPLDYWIERARSKVWYEAKEAIEVLAAAGDAGAVACPVLVDAIDRKELAVPAIRALGGFGEAAGEAVPVLIKTLRKEELRAEVIVALGNMGQAGEAAIPELLRLAREPVRPQVLAALERLGHDLLPMITEDLGDPDYRTEALERVLELGPKAESTVRQLNKILNERPVFRPPTVAVRTQAAAHRLQQLRAAFEKLKREAAHQRALAAQALGRMGTPDRAMRMLQVAMKDDDPEASRSAVWALLMAGERGIKPLVKLLQSKRYTHGEMILEGFETLGPAAERALPLLRKLARKSTTRGGEMAGEAIIAIERSLEHLEHLEDADPQRRRAAIEALLVYGAGALPAAERVVVGDDPTLHEILLQHFAGGQHPGGQSELPDYPQVEPPPLPGTVLIPLIEKCLQGNDPELVALACRCTSKIGLPDAAVLLPLLEGKVAAADLEVLQRLTMSSCLVALGQVAALDEDWIEAMPKYLGSDDPSIQTVVLELLSGLGPRAAAAVPGLVAILGESNAPRQEIARALVQVRVGAVPRLVTALGSESNAVRAWAAYALGLFGPDAKIAETALEKALGDPDLEVQAMAEQALRVIRQPRAPGLGR